MDREKLLRIKAKCKKFFIYMKFMALIVLTFLYLQNQFFLTDISSNFTLVPKISAVAGIFQIFLFTMFIHIEEGSVQALKNNLVKHIFCDVKTTFKMALPSVLLLIYNQLLLLSTSILPRLALSAGNYTIVGVTVFTVLMIKKKFFLSQALAVYFIARGLDQFQTSQIELSSALQPDFDSYTALHGYFAIVLAILCYGLSYVTLEKVLKSSDVSLWIRGIQLNLFNVPLSLAMSFANDWLSNDSRGFFDSFNIIVWFFIIFKVAQQMMELFVIKVADSIYRCMSLAAALVIIGILREPFSLDEFSWVKLGTGLVIAGVCLYTVMDHFPKWGEIYDTEVEPEYRESPSEFMENNTKGEYQTVPTVSSFVSNAT